MFKADLKNQEVVVGSKKSYVLPTISDEDGDYVVVIFYTKDSNKNK